MEVIVKGKPPMQLDVLCVGGVPYTIRGSNWSLAGLGDGQNSPRACMYCISHVTLTMKRLPTYLVCTPVRLSCYSPGFYWHPLTTTPTKPACHTTE